MVGQTRERHANVHAFCQAYNLHSCLSRSTKMVQWVFKATFIVGVTRFCAQKRSSKRDKWMAGGVCFAYNKSFNLPAGFFNMFLGRSAVQLCTWPTFFELVGYQVLSPSPSNEKHTHRSRFSPVMARTSFPGHNYANGKATLGCPRLLDWVAGKMASETTNELLRAPALLEGEEKPLLRRYLRQVGPGLLAWMGGGGGGGGTWLLAVSERRRF